MSIKVLKIIQRIINYYNLMATQGKNTIGNKKVKYI